MRVLVLGANGMLGHKLLQILGEDFEVRGTVRSDASTFDDHPVLGGIDCAGGVDVTDLDRLEEQIAWAREGAVINAIGVVKQLAAAKDPIESITINALHPHRAAKICARHGARFLHLSTDCVFSGKKGAPYLETDAPDPEDLYGRSKLLGEVTGPGCLTLRTSIVGRELGRATGLFEWCISQRGGTIRGFSGAIYSGLTTLALTRVIGTVLTHFPSLSGVRQVSSDPIDKFTLLSLLNEALDLGLTIERDTEFVCDRSLDSAGFREAVGYTPPTWQELIDDFAADPIPYEELHAAPRDR